MEDAALTRVLVLDGREVRQGRLATGGSTR